MFGRGLVVLEFLQASILPVVHGGDGYTHALGRFLVTESMTDHQFNRISLTGGEGSKSLEQVITQIERLELIRISSTGCGIVSAIIGLKESLKPLHAVVATLDQVVCDLDQVAHGDGHFDESLQMEESGKYILCDIFSNIRSKRPTAEAVDTVVVLFEKIKNNVSTIGRLRHGQVPPWLGFRRSWSETSSSFEDASATIAGAGLAHGASCPRACFKLWPLSAP
jgi:hypothetical protein